MQLRRSRGQVDAAADQPAIEFVRSTGARHKHHLLDHLIATEVIAVVSIASPVADSHALRHRVSAGHPTCIDAEVARPPGEARVCAGELGDHPDALATRRSLAGQGDQLHLHIVGRPRQVALEDRRRAARAKSWIGGGADIELDRAARVFPGIAHVEE